MEKRTLLVGVAVLEFGLEVAVDAPAEGGVDAPGVLVPALGGAGAVGDFAEELLVPADGGEETGGEFVFGFEEVTEGVGVADVGDGEAGADDFRPELPVVPGVADVSCDGSLGEVTGAATGG